MSWDERIKMTQAQTASNNAVLVSQGAMASDEAREKAKTVPHMFNLNEDPQMSGQTIHFFDESTSVLAPPQPQPPLAASLLCFGRVSSPPPSLLLLAAQTSP